MIRSMQLAQILARIEERLIAVGLTANRASILAGKKDAIRNIRRAVHEGAPNRRGVRTGTLETLAPVLKTTTQWLLEGRGEADEAARIAADDTIPVADAVKALTWTFQTLGPEIPRRKHGLPPEPSCERFARCKLPTDDP
jgi:hypothetical protein